MSAKNGMLWKDALPRIIIWAGLGALSLIVLGFILIIVGFVLTSGPREHHGDMDGLFLYAIFMLSVFYCPVAAAAGALAAVVYSIIRARKRSSAKIGQPDEDNSEAVPPAV